MKRSKYQLIFLFVILVLAAFFRFYRLGDLPQAFGRDEAALGYNALSLWLTGKDEWGNFLPLTLRSFEDNKPAVYSYLTGPFVGIFGLTEITTRLVSAISGVIACVLLYLLIGRRFNRPLVAPLSVLALALSPWHWEVSRTATEANLALTLGLLAVYWFLSPRRVYQTLGLLAMLTSLFTYHTPRLIMPELFIILMLVFKPNRSRYQWGVIILGVVLGGWLALTSTLNRLEQVSLFTDLGGQLIRAESIREDGTLPSTNLLTTRIFHNKFETWTRIFLANFNTNTSIRYLFFGPGEPPRTAIPETGQFLLIFAPAYLVGFIVIFRRFRPYHLFMLGWLLLSVLPASLTVADTPSSYRTLFLIVPVSYFIGEGLAWFLARLKDLPYHQRFSPIILSLTLLIVGYTGVRAWHQYSVHQQVHKPWYRQYGYRDLFSQLAQFPPELPITITNMTLGEPYIYTLFYNRVHPAIYQQSPEKRLSPLEMSRGKTSFNFNRFTYSEAACPYPDQPASPSLYVVAAECPLRPGYQRINTIRFMDGQPIFHLDYYDSSTL